MHGGQPIPGEAQQGHVGDTLEEHGPGAGGQAHCLVDGGEVQDPRQVGLRHARHLQQVQGGGGLHRRLLLARLRQVLQGAPHQHGVLARQDSQQQAKEEARGLAAQVGGVERAAVLGAQRQRQPARGGGEGEDGDAQEREKIKTARLPKQ